MKTRKLSETGLSQVIGVVQIVFMILLLAYIFNLNKQLGRINKKLAALSTNSPKAPETISLVPDDRSPGIGDNAAVVNMTIFSDFECSFCKIFATEILPRLKEKYVDKGFMRVNFRHLPLAIHKSANMAAEASACINEQGGFWDLHDYLFKNQEKLSDALIYTWAGNNKLDTGKLKGCLINHTLKGKVQKDIDEAHRVGILGTPAIIINGKLIMGARSLGYFADIIEKEIAKRAPLTALNTLQ